MTIRRLHGWGRKVLVGGGALLLGWTGTASAFAQGVDPRPQAVAAVTASVQRNFLNKNTIQLPIQINEQSRSLIAEIHLYVKDHPNAEWTMRDKVNPSAKAFTYQVPRDGEYWFAMVTIDKTGKAYPSDLRSEPPGLVVIIDTTAPQIELINLGTTSDGQLIQFDVRDPNIDNARTRFEFQGGDRQFRPLEPVTGRSNVFCIPAQAVCTGIVRGTAEDLAGNQATREIHLDQMATLKAQQAAAVPPQQAIIPPPPLEVGMPRKLPTGVGGAPDLPPRDISIAGQKPDLPPRDINIVAQKTEVGTNRPDWKGGSRVEQPIEAPKYKVESPVQQFQPVHHQETLKRQFVNSTRVFLDYQVENAGQSGIGKVEVWVTRDRAKTWQKVNEDTQRKSPVEVQFPGEGIFGVTLVATNARGVAAAPPAAGDAPDWWIEVDTTKPAAQFTKIHSTIENGKSVVHIHWSAQDKNLSDGGVDLVYSATAQGPWLMIAKGLKAEGYFRWTPPVEIGAQAHVRMIARDDAGNSTIVASQEPIQLDDAVRPRAVIRGISTGTSGNGLSLQR